MQKIDGHCHVRADHPDSIALLDSLDLRILNIALGTDPVGKWRSEGMWGSEGMEQAAKTGPRHCAWVTAFDEPRLNDPGWADSVIAGLEADFSRGAVAAKVWRNIGLKVRRPGAGNILPDDPVFTPVFSWLEKHHHTVVMHVGEPAEAWMPLDPASHRYSHYIRNPGEHYFGKPGIPAYGELIAARDRILERHPRLRVVGCHLGSMEHDVREVARRLERYPNFAVDTSARVPDLARQDRGLVREFFEEHSGRIIWGTDVFTEKPHSVMTVEERAASLADLRRRWSEDAEYFESPYGVPYLGWQEQPEILPGLGLSAGVLQDLFLGSALRWYPGLFRPLPPVQPSS